MEPILNKNFAGVGSLMVYTTSALFTSGDPILKKGQIGKETDTNRYKQGDGVTAWQDLTHAEWGFEIVEAVGTGAYASTFSKPFFLGYFPMMRVRVRFGAANVGATSLNLNSLGAVTIVKNVSTALVDNDILAGGIYELVYNGTNFQMVTPASTLYSAGGGGTVTSVAWTTSQGVSASISNPTTTPDITITLGALTGVTSFNGLVITANTGVVTTGIWRATPVELAYGGTNANLTASLGGIFYSTGTAGAILAGTATAGQMLRSGASAAPTWSTNTWPNTTTVDQILYATAANVIGSSADLTYDGAGIFGVVRNQNAITNIKVANSTSGTAGRSVISAVLSTLAAGISIQALSAGYTTSGMFVADRGILACNMAGGLNIGTSSNDLLSFWTNNTEKVEISAVGNMSLGGTAVRATTVGTNTHQIFNGTAPVGTLANGVSLFSAAGILKTADAAGVVAFVLASSAVTTEVVVTDTTLTIKHNGTTYKILAKA